MAIRKRPSVTIRPRLPDETRLNEKSNMRQYSDLRLARQVEAAGQACARKSVATMSFCSLRDVHLITGSEFRPSRLAKHAGTDRFYSPLTTRKEFGVCKRDGLRVYLRDRGIPFGQKSHRITPALRRFATALKRSVGKGSLWKAATRFTETADGRSEALRRAQLTLKDRYPDPFIWGALFAKVTGAQ